MHIGPTPPTIPLSQPVNLVAINQQAGENLIWALDQASDYAQRLGLGLHMVTLKHHGYNEQRLEEETLNYLEWLDIILHYDGPHGPCCAEIGGLVAGYGQTASTTPHARCKEEILQNLKTLIDDYLQNLDEESPRTPVEYRGILDTIEG